MRIRIDVSMTLQGYLCITIHASLPIPSHASSSRAPETDYVPACWMLDAPLHQQARVQLRV